MKPHTELLSSLLNKHRFLILAHRGLALGNIIENTIQSMHASFSAGADAVEMDVIASTDGEFYVIHDGYEERLFHGVSKDIRQMSSSEINALEYRNAIGELSGVKVDSLSSFLAELPQDKLINMDRSWPYLNTLLPYLDTFEIAERLLLKTKAIDKELEIVANHTKKYMFIAICRSKTDIKLAQLYEKQGLNLVGFELIAANNQHELFQADYLSELKQQGYLLSINALNLEKGVKLWGDYDDDTSVIKGAEYGWGKIIKQGIDIIDTDWPGLLANYRHQLQNNV